MNNTNAAEIKGIRMAAEAVVSNGQYAVVVGKSVKMFNLTAERAAEFARYYLNGEVVSVDTLN